jgi:hypothetical protein
MQKAKNKRTYVCYWEWEEWHSGMWRTLHISDEPYFLNKAIKFTGDHLLYGKAMREVIKLWPRTMLHNLTNPSINYKAFIGHCATSYAINCPEYITRQAWRMLNEEQQSKANQQAENAYQLWKKEYRNT